MNVTCPGDFVAPNTRAAGRRFTVDVPTDRVPAAVSVALTAPGDVTACQMSPKRPVEVCLRTERGRQEDGLPGNWTEGVTLHLSV